MTDKQKNTHHCKINTLELVRLATPLRI